MKLLLRGFQFVLGCHHSQMSRVFTIKKRTYQVCCECGEEFEFSWALMHRQASNNANSPYVPLNSVTHADGSVI
jgi:hypothetical protein